MKKLYLAFALIIFSILFRTLWHFAPNVEFITAATFLSGRYLGKKYAILVPFASIVISDFLLGNTKIYLFTWSAYLMVGLMSLIFAKIGHKNLILKAGAMGIIASFWFYLWTNFGVWFLDGWGMYPKTFQGLIQCYIRGLPFLKLTLLGNLIFMPLSFWLVEKIKEFNFKTLVSYEKR